MARCRCSDRETPEARGFGRQHPPAKPQSGLAGGDGRTEHATVLPPPPQALPPYHPAHDCSTGAFSPSRQQGNAGFKCPALCVESKISICAFPKYSWPMHCPSWLALLPAQLQLEKKGPASSLGCLTDHQTKQQSGQLPAEAPCPTLFSQKREIICL